MIDFACKKFNIEEVIRCSFNLSKGEFLILKIFLLRKNSFLSTQEVKKLSGFDLSTVQRATKKLYEKGLLNRSQSNLKRGGYVFYYRIKSREEIRRKIISTIQNWVNRVETEFNNW